MNALLTPRNNGSDKETAHNESAHTASKSRMPRMRIPAPTAGPAPLADGFTRPRNRRGDRVGTRGVYDDPVMDGTPILETDGGKRVLERIAEKRPAHAADLQLFHDHRLMPAREKALAVIAEVKDEMADWNARAAQFTDSIDAVLTELDSETERLLEPLNRAVESAEAAVDAQKIEVAQACAAIGQAPPSSPDEIDAFVKGPARSRVSITGEHGTPFVESDRKALLPTGLSWIFTVVIGLLIGVSIGLVAGFIQPDTLATTWSIALVCAGIGVAPAALMKHVVMLGFRAAGERSALGLPWLHRLGYWTSAWVLALVVLAIDIVVEREGILRWARLQQEFSDSHPTPDIVWTLVAAIVTLGFVACAAWEGLLKGRYSAHFPRLVWLQEEDSRRRGEERLANPAMQRAVGAALLLQHLEGRLRQAVAARDAEVANRKAMREAVENRLPQILESPTPEQQKRIQDAYDDVRGAQHEFDWSWNYELELVEPTPIFRFWTWLRFWMRVRTRR